MTATVRARCEYAATVGVCRPPLSRLRQDDRSCARWHHDHIQGYSTICQQLNLTLKNLQRMEVCDLAGHSNTIVANLDG